MKLSVSLPDTDVEFLDDYVRHQSLGSRSAAVQRAVRLLRASQLGAAYEAAWDEWAADGGGVWDATIADGLG